MIHFPHTLLVTLTGSAPQTAQNSWEQFKLNKDERNPSITV